MRAQGTEAVVAAVAGVRSIEKISPVPKAGETEFSFNSRITTSQALMELLQIEARVPTKQGYDHLATWLAFFTYDVR